MKKLALLAMFVVMGLAFARPEAPDYIWNQYEKAECMRDVGWGMAETIDCNFIDCCGMGCPGWNIGDEIDGAMEAFLSDVEGGDYASAAQEYAYIVSLYNQMKALYLQYGIEYVLDGGDEDFEDIGDLVNDFLGYQGGLLGCFGGEEIPDGDVTTAYGS